MGLPLPIVGFLARPSKTLDFYDHSDRVNDLKKPPFNGIHACPTAYLARPLESVSASQSANFYSINFFLKLLADGRTSVR
jgi:hypothetical protein